VRVDEAWANDQAIGIDRAACRAIDIANRRDLAVRDGQISSESRASSSVDDHAVLDEKIVHLFGW
jgi:hypothetical protein